MSEKIKLGISSCLLGEKVRYDGGHKMDRFLVDVLGEYVQYVSVCPEVEIGLGIPREPVRLVGDSESPRLMSQKTKIDYTDKMSDWADHRLDHLEKEALCGYVFKTRSPSSGLNRIKVYGTDGNVRNNGIGIFARAFIRRFPNLPVEDEGRLNDIELRESFIVRIFTYHRWLKLQNINKTPGGLVDFHTKNKLLFMAHHPELAKQLGKITANGKQMPIDELFSYYEKIMMQCMQYKSTARKNTNVLYHILGYFKKHLTPAEKQELTETIENYRNSYIPLVVPLTLIKHYVRKFDQTYLKDQYYLDPHPLELKLRNHA